MADRQFRTCCPEDVNVDDELLKCLVSVYLFTRDLLSSLFSNVLPLLASNRVSSDNRATALYVTNLER